MALPTTAPSTPERRVVFLDVDGTYLTLRAAARQMVAQGDGGSLVATSSIAARFGSARNATSSNGTSNFGS